MFEQAARAKLRFDSPRGMLSVEDLWDLPLRTERDNGLSLDRMAVALHQEIKTTVETSFVDTPPKPNVELQLKFDIIKHVIDVKKQEEDAAKLRVERAATKARILEILARKQDEKLAQASVEELEAQLASL